MSGNNVKFGTRKLYIPKHLRPYFQTSQNSLSSNTENKEDQAEQPQQHNEQPVPPSPTGKRKRQKKQVGPSPLLHWWHDIQGNNNNDDGIDLNMDFGESNDILNEMDVINDNSGYSNAQNAHYGTNINNNNPSNNHRSNTNEISNDNVNNTNQNIHQHKQHKHKNKRNISSNSYQYAGPMMYQLQPMQSQMSMQEKLYRLQNQVKRRAQHLSNNTNNFKDKILAKMPEYANVIEQFGEAELYYYYQALRDNYHKSTTARMFNLGDGLYVIPIWQSGLGIGGGLSNKHFQHCHKSKGTGELLCKCKFWKLWNQRRCVHSLLSEICNRHSEIDLDNIAVVVNDTKHYVNEYVTLLGTVNTDPRCRSIAYFSVRPQSRFDTKFAIVAMYADGQMVCDLDRYYGQHVCGHKASIINAYDLQHGELVHTHKTNKRIRVENNRIFLKKPISTRRVPLPRKYRCYWPGLFDDVKSYPEYDAFKISDRDTSTPFDVEATECRECGASLGDAPLIRQRGILYGMYEGVHIQLGSKKCLKCKHWNHFDGYSQHIMNRDTIKCFDHSLMWLFWLGLFHQPKSSIHAFQATQDCIYRNNQSKIDFPYVSAIWEALKSFYYIILARHKLLCGFCDTNWIKSLDLPPSGQVQKLGTDGVCTGGNENDSYKLINPKTVFDETFIIDNIIHETNRFIINKKDRILLQRYLFQHLPAIQRDRASKGKGKKDPNYLPPLSANELATLKQHLRECRYECVIRLMDWLNTDNYNSLDNRRKQYCADWFRVISTDEPVYSACPYIIIDILIAGKDSIDQPVNKNIILHKLPLLFPVLFDMGPNFEWPIWFYQLLKKMAELSRHVFNLMEQKVGNEERPATEEQQQIWGNYCVHGTHFSGTGGAKRQLPLYTMDLRNKRDKQNREKRKRRTKLKYKREKKTNDSNNDNDDNNNNNNENENDGDDDESDDSMGDMNEENVLYGRQINNRRFDKKIIEELTQCNKRFIDQNDRPAMMVFRCIEHGTCVGRHMMPKKESPLDIFAFLYVFYDKFPDLLTADHICHGHPQMMARAPHLAREVVCASDGPHDNCHTYCSMVYCIKYHKAFVPDYYRIQDVSLEQRHIILNKLRHMGVWASGEMFMVLSAFLLELDNRRIHIQLVGHDGVHRRTSYDIDPNHLQSWADDYDRFNTVEFAGDPNWDKFLNLNQQNMYVIQASSIQEVNEIKDNQENNNNENGNENNNNRIDDSIHMNDDILVEIGDYKSNQIENNDNGNETNDDDRDFNAQSDQAQMQDDYDRLFNNPDLISGDENDVLDFEPINDRIDATVIENIGKLLDQIDPPADVSE